MWHGYNTTDFIFYCRFNRLNIQEFCEKHEIKLTTVKKFLKDSKNITVTELNKIATILNVTVKELFREENLYSKLLTFK